MYLRKTNIVVGTVFIVINLLMVAVNWSYFFDHPEDNTIFGLAADTVWYTAAMIVSYGWLTDQVTVKMHWGIKIVPEEK